MFSYKMIIKLVKYVLVQRNRNVKISMSKSVYVSNITGLKPGKGGIIYKFYIF
jgi:hypothetical protein